MRLPPADVVGAAVLSRILLGVEYSAPSAEVYQKNVDQSMIVLLHSQ